MFWDPSVDVSVEYDKFVGPGQTIIEACLTITASGFKPPDTLDEHVFGAVLDISESMGSEGRLDEAKKAACEWVRLMTDRDRFFIVVFRGDARVLCPTTRGDAVSKGVRLVRSRGRISDLAVGRRDDGRRAGLRPGVEEAPGTAATRAHAPGILLPNRHGE